MIIVKNGPDLKTAMLYQMTIEHFYSNSFDPNNVKSFSVRALSSSMPTPFFDLDDYNLLMETINEEQKKEQWRK